MTKELIAALKVAHAALSPFHKEILSVDISKDRISAHLSGTDFSAAVDEFKPVVEGSFAKSGYHCGFNVPESTVHLHALLQ